MNGYPANHDARAREPEHERLEKEVNDWKRTHEVEVLPFGAVSKGYQEREEKRLRWSSKLPWLDIEG